MSPWATHWPRALTRLTPRWLTHSIRNKLLAMALLPLLVVLPLLVAALVLWGNAAYDRLLITKVRSDLAVANGYFEQVRVSVGSGTQAVADSHTLHQALAKENLPALEALLKTARVGQGFDFVNLYSPSGQLMSADWTHTPALDATTPALTMAQAAELPAPGIGQAALTRLSAPTLLALAPHLASRIQIPLIATRSAAPTTRTQEDRALVMLSSVPLRDEHGQTHAVLRAGVLLNQNLALIDHINSIVYPSGSLPLGSHGTATLFLDDVRIVTNVRLFQQQRAVGTRVSEAVRDTVLTRGQPWLDRAFVVNDWYVSAYEPLHDHAGQRVGMLYVGYLEEPFRQVKWGMLALIIGIFGLVIVLAALFSLRWARSIFKPVEQMNEAMQQVQDGHASARVGPVAAQDEVGALATHLDQLLDAVDEKTQALQQAARDLDAKVTERTQELAHSNSTLQHTQQQLIQSEKLAAIGQLTASVAHEINNPIAVIQGNLDLMRDLLGAHAQPVRAELTLIDEQVSRMRLIVTQLLQQARPGDYAGYVEPVDVNQAVSSALVLVAHLLNAAPIQVVRELHAHARTDINRQELQQVLINLLSNAIQAMPEGGTLHVHTRDEPDATGCAGVLIRVSDTGPGISAAVYANLFRPFVTTRPQGNGLGLWISKGLLERYGGHIRAHNHRELGQDRPGAVFSVWLPQET